MYLFFDTETTGLPRNWKAPVSDVNNWPRMVQLAWLVFDEAGTRTGAGNYIVKPEGYSIPDDVSRIHKISTERAMSEGVELHAVLDEFMTQISEAGFLVAHNISFDEKIVGAEFLRLKMTNALAAKKKICTMVESKNYCKLDGPYGYKFPKLSELYFKLFATKLQEAHNASVDIEATARCFWELRKLGIV